MAVRTREEIMTAVRGRLGDATDDETLQLFEDIDDTLRTIESEGPAEDWEARYHDLDASWRQRYRDRFFTQGEEGDGATDEAALPDDPPDGSGGPKTFDDLFTVKEV